MSGARAEKPLWAVSECFRAFCIGMDTPRSLKAAMLLKHGQLEDLVRMKIHPSEYTSADSFAADYAVVSFLKKNVDLPIAVNTREAAITAFASSEDHCERTNARLEQWQAGQANPDPRVVEVLHLAQRKIAHLLREAPVIDDGPYSWGPGAVFEMSTKRAYPDSKTVELPFFVTGAAWKHAVAVINADLHWKAAIIAANSDYSGDIFKIVPGGRYGTVDKTALTDRSILVEPRLNTLLQKRVGSQLRALLKRVGVDLDDQSINQGLASMAQALSLATLDLEAASDTVSRKLVEILLPPLWFDLLDDLRSQWYLNDEKQWVRLEKFSSMGNGFTFELESLIFWALASAASDLNYRSIVGVYGDDIIVHSDVVTDLVAALTYAGFKLNAEKSFVSGRFFESCGKHYFDGVDVTPLYQKCSPDSYDEACRMANRLLRFSSRLGLMHTFDKRVRGAWEFWRRHWDGHSVMSYGPFIGEGDGYWEAPFSYLTGRTRLRGFGSEYQVSCYSPVTTEIPCDDGAMYALWLMQNPTSGEDRGRIVGDKRASTLAYASTLHSNVSLKKGANGKIEVTSIFADSGYLPSRTKSRMRWQRRWVPLELVSTGLDW